MPLAARRALAAALFLLLASLAVKGEDTPRSKITRAGKSATALVIGRYNTARGSAFCVHAGGLFLTNEHVIRDEADLRLVLDSGLRTARVVSATVVRADKTLDLA